MKNVKSVLLVFHAGLQRTISDRKMLLLLLIIGFILDNGVRKMVDHAVQVGQPLGVFEGFIMCANHWYYLILFFVGFIFILTDIPRLDSNHLFIIYRTGKRKWFLGEILQIFACALSYVLVLLAGCMLSCARYSFWGNVWSNFTIYYKSDYEGMLSDSNRFIDQQVFKYYLPFQSVSHCVVLLTLCLTLMGTIILFFSIIHKKLVGIVLNVLLILFVMIFNVYHADIMWISPFCHAVLALHNIYVYRQLSVPIGYSYLYLLFCQGVLMVASVKMLKNKVF